jgi:hypothetical protein
MRLPERLDKSRQIPNTTPSRLHMTRLTAPILILWLCLCLGIRAFAADDLPYNEDIFKSGANSPSSSSSIQLGRWDIGIDFGNIVPLKRYTYSHDIDNVRVLDLLQAEAVGDEVAEGFKPPPFPGHSMVIGTMKPVGEIGGHFFYQWSPWMALGLEGGYGFSRAVFINDPGIYTANNFLRVEFFTQMYHFDAPVKFGQWYGIFKPHFLIGPGAYIAHERVRLSFNDSDDPQLKPQNVIDDSTIYFGIDSGAGLDIKCGERGVISLDLEYHKVFSPLGRFDFLLPQLSGSVLF